MRRQLDPAAVGLLLAFVAAGCMAEAEPAAESEAKPPAIDRGQARASYLEGRRLWQTRRPDALLASVGHFEAAIAADPDYALAHAGLADASALLGLYSVLAPAETMPRALRAAKRALELEPDLAAAHASLGLARYLYHWDFAGAETSFRHAIELEPGQATVHLWYAMLLTAVGRHDEAVATSRAALELEPDSQILNIKTATVLTAAGHFDEARSQLLHILERFPDAPLAHRELGFLELRLHATTGDESHLQAAVADFERAAELSGGAAKSTGGLGFAYGVLGRRDRAERVLEELTEAGRSSFLPPMYLALVHLGLDRTEEALAELERSESIHDPGLVYLAVKPGFERLYGDVRFRSLLARIGLPAGHGRAPLLDDLVVEMDAARPRPAALCGGPIS